MKHRCRNGSKIHRDSGPGRLRPTGVLALECSCFDLHVPFLSFPFPAEDEIQIPPPPPNHSQAGAPSSMFFWLCFLFEFFHDSWNPFGSNLR